MRKDLEEKDVVENDPLVVGCLCDNFVTRPFSAAHSVS